MNYVRARLALEPLPPGAWLQVDLDPGEPEEMVAVSLRGDGHHVEQADPPAAPDHSFVRLLIQRGG